MVSIVAQSLTRCYGRFRAVRDISFEVNGGTVLGFLGPNGAGKSTTMRMLTGYLRPSSGRAWINGHDIMSDRIQAQRQLGYLPEGGVVYPEMTVGAFLSFIASVRGLRGEQRRKAIHYVSERLELVPVIRQSIQTLSKGFGRRVGLAQAMIHNPKVLILDEPTEGLDPIQKAGVRKLIHELAEDKIIIISTHILEEVELLCQRMMVIAQGELKLDDTPQGARGRSRYAGAVTILADDPQSKASRISALPEVRGVELRGGQLTAFPSGVGRLEDAIQALIRRESWQVREFHLELGRLDDVFSRAVKDD